MPDNVVLRLYQVIVPWLLGISRYVFHHYIALLKFNSYTTVLFVSIYVSIFSILDSKLMFRLRKRFLKLVTKYFAEMRKTIQTMNCLIVFFSYDVQYVSYCSCFYIISWSAKNMLDCLLLFWVER